ncbi:hypothetical protein PG996_013777 [Apiospora saccharicola]|uniref:Uncharacterized protein n=1 Tax=Apiospora saccharicola TaxID=335842 RepID=A0ABR1TGF5_9PEZI
MHAARSYRLPEHLASTYGVDPGYAKFRPADGGGYPALFEFPHQLHCVNLARQATRWNYGYYAAQGAGALSNPEGILRRHADHCLDILRQAVMCQPDTGVFGQYWVAATNEIGTWSGEDLGERPFVDFHTTHRCQNFEELRGWVVGHQISAEFKATAKLERRPGDRVLPGIP